MKIERLRWTFACLLNRLPGYCWPDLVMWALDGPKASGRGWIPLPHKSKTQSCKADVDRVGYCYCGKFRRDESEVSS